MRNISNQKELLVTVDSDLRMTEDYIAIQKMRFRERLHVEIDIDSETRNRMIPRISIQPLVENSVKYVMEEQLSSCSIRIFDRIGSEFTEIIVEDNGAGFDEDIMGKIESGVLSAHGNGTALLNIHKRLRYAFSDPCGLSFRKQKDGMQVIIRIPNSIDGIRSKV